MIWLKKQEKKENYFKEKQSRFIDSFLYGGSKD